MSRSENLHLDLNLKLAARHAEKEFSEVDVFKSLLIG
jgi:hypothetical protein